MNKETRDQDQHPGNPSRSDSELSDSTASVASAVHSVLEPLAPGESRAGSPSRIVIANQNFPESLADGLELFQGSDGHAYHRQADSPHLPVLRVGSRASDAFLRRLAYEHGKYPRANDIRDINENLISHAEFSGVIREVWYRVAPIEGGVAIYLGDEFSTLVNVTAGGMTLTTKGSKVLFYRTPTMRALPVPAKVGDLRRLRKYLNLPEAEKELLIAWISYVLAHAKLSGISFVILVIFGEQGSGKSWLCKIIQALTDPNEVCLRTFPRSARDLAIAAQQAHVLLFDNMREIHPSMSDALCTAATGGTFATRMLFRDDVQVAMRLHGPVVLNGLHAFAKQPDLAQRSLLLTMNPIDESERRSEAALDAEFQVDLPYIFRGLLDLIAGVFAHLPTVQVTSPERMIDFTHWLAAMEAVYGVPDGPFQAQFSHVLKSGMLESLLEDPVAVAVLELIGDAVGSRWSGTPADLLRTLDAAVTNRTHYLRDWPANEIGLSKRLKSLQVAFRRQGVDVRLSRSKTRLITITRVEEASHD